MKLLRAAPVALVVLAASLAHAQTNWRDVAVPAYVPSDFARSEALGQLARARTFASAAAAMQSSFMSACEAGTVAPAELRTRWKEAAGAWDALAAFPTGPLVERRSARAIDFMPVRREALQRAIASAPRTPEALERIGAPSRGFSALEAILWPTPPAAGSPACAFAAVVAAGIAREAHGIAQDAARRADATLEDEEAAARVAEAVNQWVAGLEQLRTTFMRKPLDVAAARGAKPEFPRAASGQAVATWKTRWESLRDVAILGDRPVPAKDQDGIAFETYLRGFGRNPVADELVAAVRRADRAMGALAAPAPANAKVRAAADALGKLSQVMQDRVASALEVRIGFSDADGD